MKRYTDLAKRLGVRYFEWTNLFTQWGAKHAIRIYENQGAEERLLWSPETPATSNLPELPGPVPAAISSLPVRRRSFGAKLLSCSDEPHGEEHVVNYTRARAMLKELAPWMPVMDALSEIRYGREQLTDMPVPKISVATDFVAEKSPAGVTTAVGRARYLNRLMDTPLAKIRMNGWLFYRWPFKGFLHWGYNYWYQSQTRRLIDPFSTQDGLMWPVWAYGDSFMVYPGADGPIDSIRWTLPRACRTTRCSRPWAFRAMEN